MTRLPVACVWLLAAVAGPSLIPAIVAAADSPAVPYRVQRAITKAHPLFADVPTRLPAGYHYAKYVGGRTGFDIWFSKPGEAPDQLGYHVMAASCARKGLHTFRMNGVTVFWSATYEDQQAWRCLRRARRSIVLTASRSVPGDEALNTPKRRRDALDLVRLVAYSQRIR
jgi:hypothetical protein